MPRGTISVASSGDFRTVFLIAPHSGRVSRVRAPDKMVDLRADLSADGKWLAIAGLRGVWLFSRNGTNARFLGLDTKEFSAGEVAWSPSGRAIVFTRVERLFTFATSGAMLRKLLDGPVYAPDWSPTGTFIVFVRDPAPSSGAGLIQSVSPDGRNLRTIVRGGHPDVSPDGRKLAFARRDGLYVMRLAGGKPKLIIRNGEHPEWSPDGRYLAFTRPVVCDEAGCAGRVFIVRATGGSARPIGPKIFEIGPLSWSR